MSPQDLTSAIISGINAGGEQFLEGTLAAALPIIWIVLASDLFFRGVVIYARNIRLIHKKRRQQPGPQGLFRPSRESISCGIGTVRGAYTCGTFDEHRR